MSVKKRTMKSRGEHLYMFEIFIDRLSLNSEVTSPDIENLIFSLKFSDLPVYEIHVARHDEAISQNRQADESLNEYKYGKSCLFTNKPNCLIKAMRWSSLSVELYDKDAISAKKKNSPSLLGTAKMSLPACMCNRVISAQKETDGEAASCTIKETFDVGDQRGQVIGNVTMVLRLSCFGSSAVQHFGLSGKSFMLDDSPMRKFLCSYRDEDKDGRSQTGADDSKKTVLKRPDSPPRIPIDDPAFKTLTTAEKLNDPKYRELVYQAYPNEPTCSCSPNERSAHSMKCQSGCTRSCCMKLRNPDILNSREDANVEQTTTDTYCVHNRASARHALQESSSCDNVIRLRGGGDIQQIYLDPASYRWVEYDPDYYWYESQQNYEPRLEGGADKDMSTCSCSGGPVFVPLRQSTSKDANVVTVFDACSPRVTSTGPTAGCSCPGKNGGGYPRGAAKCMKKPCQGIDCLIRAFKDAQEFVDSIGKVPGLPGLGLMDPSESPYFGRGLEGDYLATESTTDRKKGPGVPTGPSTCPAPCGAAAVRQMDDGRSTFGPALPRGISVPPRLGIVREAIPVLPEVGSTFTSGRRGKKDEKRDEKADKLKDPDASSNAAMDIEMGPCGEPKCKSRRKRAADNVSQRSHSITSMSSKTRKGVTHTVSVKGRRKVKQNKPAPKRRPQTAGDDFRNINPLLPSQQTSVYRNANIYDKQTSAAKMHVGKAMGAGPGGDRDVSPVMPSKRVMRYVYFLGDYYPGVTYGHRNCMDVRMRVPANMGWLWNTMATSGKLKPRIGWRPGAIGRTLYELLQLAKDNSFLQEEAERGRGKGGSRTDRGRTATDRGRDRPKSSAERARSAPSRQRSLNRRQRNGRTMSYQGMQKQSKMECEEEDPDAPPTLHIHRKDGTYYVTMYPIRPEEPEDRVAEPLKPLQFKIVKNKDEDSDASSSTASDMEIEFSPPAANTVHRKKPDVVHVLTQVCQQEIFDAVKTQESKVKNKRLRKEKRLRRPAK